MILPISQGNAYGKSLSPLFSPQRFFTGVEQMAHDALIHSKWVRSGNGTNGFGKSIHRDRPSRFTWGKYLQSHGKLHIISVAPIHMGKNLNSIITNPLNYSGSMFIIDPQDAKTMIKRMENQR